MEDSGCAACEVDAEAPRDGEGGGEQVPADAGQVFQAEPLGGRAKGDGCEHRALGAEDRRGDETDARLRLLVVHGVPGVADAVDFCQEGVDVHDRAWSEGGRTSAGVGGADLVRAQTGQEALAGGGGVERPALANARADLDALGALDAVDYEDVHRVAYEELNGLVGLGSEALEVWTRGTADIQTSECEAAELGEGWPEAEPTGRGILDEEALLLERTDEAEGRGAMDGEQLGQLAERVVRPTPERKEQR